VLRSRASTLHSVGLSRSKASYIYDAAEAMASDALSAERLEALPTFAAAAELRRLRGIGPWSASVVLLRGLGRLDAFPLNDSGVLRSMKILSGDPHVKIDGVLDALGSVRGVLYFHLLLGMRRMVVHREGLEPPTK
jgi:DNA-3-methyladenine glycosylase II